MKNIIQSGLLIFLVITLTIQSINTTKHQPKKLNQKYIQSLFASKRKKLPNGKKVVVVGGGFSGLMAAHELIYAGYDVQVLEGRNRVGGRTLSVSTHSDEWKYLNTTEESFIEYGAEVIGRGQRMWIKMKKILGLNFDLPMRRGSPPFARRNWGRSHRDLTEVAIQAEEYRFYFLDHLNVTHLTPENLISAFLAFDEKLLVDSKRVFYPDPIYPYLGKKKLQKWNLMKQFDQRTVADELQDFVDAQEGVTAAEKELIFRFISELFLSNNAESPDKQSYLFHILTLKNGNGEAVEYYRCKEGTQQLAIRLQKRINAQTGCSVDLGKVVKTIDTNSESDVKIYLKDSNTPIVADYVVVTVPPSLMGASGENNIKFDPVLKIKNELDEPVSFFIKDKVQMGNVLKYALKTKQHVIHNTDIVTIAHGNYYDTIPNVNRHNPAGPGVCMVFSTPLEVPVGGTLEKIFEGTLARILELSDDFKYTADNSTGGVMTKWWEDPFSLGAYSVPQKGLITSKIGNLLINGVEGALNSQRIVFGGEATAFGYSGYMEGALVSGARCAQIIYKRDN